MISLDAARGPLTVMCTATYLCLLVLPSSGVRSLSSSNSVMANVSLDVSAAPSNLSTASSSSSASGGSTYYADPSVMLKKPVSSVPTSTLKSFYGSNVHPPPHHHHLHQLPLPLLHPLSAPYPPQPLLEESHLHGYPSIGAGVGGYGHPPYTRVKLGYGKFYFDGRQAELRCHFPYNLQIISNVVWNKMSDNLMHYLDAYRIVERTIGHTSLLLIRDVIGKDLGIYECAVTGSFYGGYPVTFYQEVHFYPMPTSPRR